MKDKLVVLLILKIGLPQLGNFQVFGSYGLTNTLDLQYAGWVGNLENAINDMDAGDDFNYRLNGSNNSTGVSVGGRLGIAFNSAKGGSLKLGGSFVMDQDNMTEL